MTLKKINLVPLCLLLMTSTGFSALTVIDSTSGTILGTSTTYTVTSTDDITIKNDGINTAENNTITITFTAPVDLTIAPHLSNTTAVFSNTSPNNTFVGDTGSWSFTAGTLTSSLVSDPSPWYVISGSTITTNKITDGGDHSSGAPRANEDWGSFTISGVQTFTWNALQDANNEAYRFLATAAVPEPSGSVLLGLGFLVLLARRNR